MDDYGIAAGPTAARPRGPRRPRRRWLLMGGAALALLLALGVGALLGAQIGTSQAAGNTAQSAASGARPSDAGFADSGFAGDAAQATPASTPGTRASCEALTVSSVSGQTITAKATDGSTVTIHTTASTQYTRADQSATASAVTVGAQIHVHGTRNSDGSITATSIDIE